jgi:hypothetical protein
VLLSAGRLILVDDARIQPKPVGMLHIAMAVGGMAVSQSVLRLAIDMVG